MAIEELLIDSADAERVVPENRVVPAQPLAHPAEPELLVPVAVRPVRGQPLGRAAAERIALAVIAHPAAEAVARSAAGEAVAVADVVAAAAVAVAVADAGDEQFSNGIKTYEIENKHHEAIKNFFTRLCDRHVRYGGIFIAGCARN